MEAQSFPFNIYTSRNLTSLFVFKYPFYLILLRWRSQNVWWKRIFPLKKTGCPLPLSPSSASSRRCMSTSWRSRERTACGRWDGGGVMCGIKISDLSIKSWSGEGRCDWWGLSLPVDFSCCVWPSANVWPTNVCVLLVSAEPVKWLPFIQRVVTVTFKGISLRLYVLSYCFNRCSKQGFSSVVTWGCSYSRDKHSDVLMWCFSEYSHLKRRKLCLWRNWRSAGWVLLWGLSLEKVSSRLKSNVRWIQLFTLHGVTLLYFTKAQRVSLQIWSI